MNLNLTFTLLGQTLKNVGVWLRSEIFSHGQLYVACSRVGKPDCLKFAVMKSEENSQSVKNIVFHEVLIDT